MEKEERAKKRARVVEKAFVIEDAAFVKFCWTEGSIGERLRLVGSAPYVFTTLLKNHKDRNYILSCLDRVYLLVGAMISSIELENSDGIQWKDILSPEHFKIMNEHRHFPLGFCLIREEPEKYVALIYIETFLQGHHLGEVMIEKLQKLFSLPVIPMDIITYSGAPGYWVKHKHLLPSQETLIRLGIEEKVNGYDELIFEPLLINDKENVLSE